MADEITIKKKVVRRGDDGYKVVSVRMKEEMIDSETHMYCYICTLGEEKLYNGYEHTHRHSNYHSFISKRGMRS